MPNPLPTPGVKGRLFFSNTGDNGGNCLAVDTGSDWKRIVLDNSVGATDSKISEIESDIELLASQVSLGNVRVSLGNLANRITSLETSGISGGISGISNAVSWTNLTEINLSGEKLVNGDFSSNSWIFDTSFAFPTTPTSGNITLSEERYIQWLDNTTANFTQNKVYEILRYATHNGDLELENDLGTVMFVRARKQRSNALDKIRGENWEVVVNVPTNWTISNGILNQTKLAEGIIKGSGSQVAIKQTFSQNIASGTKLIVKVTSDDDIKFTPIKGNGQTDLNNDFTVLGSVGYAEHTTQTIVSGFKVSTVNVLREFSSISIFQGAVSGGTVQAYAGGGLEKISGADGFNAGASSSQKIDGNSDGYVQFQIAQTGKDIKIGLVYADVDYADADPYEITFSGTDVSTDGSVRTTYAQGDFFRIRHYASTNEIKYQKRQTVYSQNTNFVFETASGSNYHYPSSSRPLVISLDGTGTLTIGELYEVYTIRNTDQALYFRDLDGNAHGYHGQGTRGVRFEVVEEAGQDYVSFQTSNTLTNGSDLYVDTSFHSVGARINDVTIVT